MDCYDLWDSANRSLRNKLDADAYQRYIASIVPLGYNDEENTITLGVLNDFVALWLDSNYKEILREVMFEVLEKDIEIQFEGGYEQDVKDSVPVNGQPRQLRTSAKTIRDRTEYTFRPDFTFENFVVGNNNRICHAAALAVCKSLGKAYNPLFIYGGVGLGKTHLLQAIANEILFRRKRAKVRYLTSEEFVNLYVEAMQKKSLLEFRRKLRGCDILIIDDVQFFTGKVGSSEEFFHTFNTLHNTHKQIVLACDRTPKEINGLEQRLVSRFEWGLSAEILPPDIETRVAILKKKQENHAIKISDDILFFIASKIQSNIRNLESALTKLIMNISAFGGNITKQRAAELLRDKFENETAKLISIETIQKRVAEFYDIRVADITGKKRPQNIALPRMIAMYLARKNTNFSLPAIGDAFNRNHATIIHAIDSIEKKMSDDEDLRNTIGQLSRQIRS